MSRYIRKECRVKRFLYRELMDFYKISRFEIKSHIGTLNLKDCKETILAIRKLDDIYMEKLYEERNKDDVV